MERPKLFTGTNFLIFSIVIISFMEFIGLITKSTLYTGPDLFFAGKYHVLITGSFIHGGLEHLLFNCLAIYVFGNLVESRIGILRTYLIFFVSSVVSGLVWVVIMPLPSLGASDGAFALMAAAVLLVPDKRITATIPYLNRLTSFKLVSNFSTVLGVAALVQILFLASFATGSGILAMLASIFSLFDPVQGIFSNITKIGDSSNVARISHVIGFAMGSFLAYVMDRDEAKSNLKIFAIYMVFFTAFYLSGTIMLKLAGLAGMIGLTLYITPDIREKDSDL